MKVCMGSIATWSWHCILAIPAYKCLSLHLNTQHADSELTTVNLQSEGPGSFGLTFKFNDCEELFIEEIHSDGIAAKVLHDLC